MALALMKGLVRVDIGRIVVPRRQHKVRPLVERAFAWPTVMLLALAAGCEPTTAVTADAVSLSLDFEGSSLGAWSLRGDTVQFSIREDTNASTRYWFSFQVDGAAGRELTFRVPASANMYGTAGWEVKQPVASADGGSTWARITDRESDAGFFQFRHTPTSNQERIALTLPYPYARWLEFRDSIADHPSVVAQEDIGASLNGRPVDWLEVTDATVSAGGKAHIWAVARQHPGEPEGSFMIQGFMTWILGDTPEAARLRRLARIHLVPFLNPDGVLAGNQRVNLAGLDLNRQWADPDATTSPTILATQTKISVLEGEGTGTRIVLDFHGAPPSRANFFIYNDAASVPAPVFAEMQALLDFAISTNPDFAPLDRSTARTVGDGERTRSWAFTALGAHGLTIEGSGTDTPYGPFAGEHLTPGRYLELGATVGQAVAEVLFPEL